MQEYAGRVRLVAKDLPLGIHAHARGAAQAARCAGRAGKYWAFHDRLFADQEHLERDDFLHHAAALNLDAAQFATCLNDETVSDAIDRDVDEAHALGIRATPTFVINGRKLEGAHPIENFRAVVDEALRAVQR